VKPVDANKITLPTDGYKSAKPLDRVLGDKQTDSKSGGARPKPSIAPAAAATPAAAPANS
jgi:hypothetical protein